MSYSLSKWNKKKFINSWNPQTKLFFFCNCRCTFKYLAHWSVLFIVLRYFQGEELTRVKENILSFVCVVDTKKESERFLPIINTASFWSQNIPGFYFTFLLLVFREDSSMLIFVIFYLPTRHFVASFFQEPNSVEWSL